MAPRTLNPATHAVKREAFVDAAARLIQTRGYEQMTIQDLLDELQASRGSFYHYFDSKSALLEEVIERLAEGGMAAIRPVAANPDLSAVEKLEGIFATIADFKAGQADLMMAILEVWKSDENAIVREKLRGRLGGLIAPTLTDIVRQGQAEGVFTVASPEDTAQAMVWLMQGAQERAMDLYLARLAGTATFDEVAGAFDGYARAVERLLGVPDRSLAIVRPDVLHRWFG
jgi:AcrR family transcriptional regulator